MPINTTFQTQEDFLIATTSGIDDNLQEVISYNNRVLEKAIEHHCRKVLCDERGLVYSLSIAETFELGELVSKNIHYIKAIAVVVNHNQEAVAMFWENVTVNRNVRAKVFTNKEDAIHWIQKLV